MFRGSQIRRYGNCNAVNRILDSIEGHANHFAAVVRRTSKAFALDHTGADRGAHHTRATLKKWRWVGLRRKSKFSLNVFSGVPHMTLTITIPDGINIFLLLLELCIAGMVAIAVIGFAWLIFEIWIDDSALHRHVRNWWNS